MCVSSQTHGVYTHAHSRRRVTDFHGPRSHDHGHGCSCWNHVKNDGRLVCVQEEKESKKNGWIRMNCDIKNAS